MPLISLDPPISIGDVRRVGVRTPPSYCEYPAQSTVEMVSSGPNGVLLG
jgi:hypothetical protein